LNLFQDNFAEIFYGYAETAELCARILGDRKR